MSSCRHSSLSVVDPYRKQTNNQRYRVSVFLTFAGYFASVNWRDSSSTSSSSSSQRRGSRNSTEVPAPLAPQRRARMHCPTRHPGRSNIINNNNNNNNNDNRTSSHNSDSTIVGTGLDRRHNCNRCGKSYKNAYILKRHLLYECGKAPSFSCPHCAFSSKYERNLKAHINHRHVDPPNNRV